MTTWNLVDPHQEGPVAVGKAGERFAQDLLALATHVARSLPPLPSGGVAVVCADRYYFACGILGVWLAGHRVVLAPNDRPDTLIEIRLRFGLLAVVGDGQAAANIDLRELEVAGKTETPLLAPSFQGERLAAYVHTSGSTGDPVVFEKTFDQLLGESHLLAEFLSMRGACVLPTVPSHHIYGLLAGVLAPLVAGACFVRETPLHAAQIVNAMERYKATVLVASPAHLKGFALWATETPKSELPAGLRRIVSSGAPLPVQIVQTLDRTIGVKVLELFGSTETGGIAHRTGIAECSWKTLPGVSVSIAKDEGRADLLENQLLVRSLFTGHEGWFATGDLVQLDGDFSFVHLGRSDSVVKVGGRRVDLGAIERCLAQVTGVQDVAVMGFPVAPPRDLEISCVLVAQGVCVQDLRAALLRVFEPVAVPRRWRFVEALPRQDNGKLKRTKLAEVFSDAPSDPTIRIGCEARTCETGSVPGQYRLSVHVPPQAWFFKGHFDGDPLMPGVVQVNDLVLAHAQRLFPELRALQQATRLKFRRPIHPGEPLTVQLALEEGGKSVRFELLVDDNECSSGVLEFSGVSA